jgi:hypothetical protein
LENELYINGNSKDSNRDQHVYEIIDSDNNKPVKYGISSGDLNKNGSSKRANEQISLIGFIRY